MIPVNEPLVGEREKELLSECIDTGWLSSEGPFVSQFEDAFAAKVSRNYGIAVTNGSAALDVAIAAIGIKAGDEVIVPTFTIISPAASIIRAGGIPILVDSDPETWNMDLSQIEPRISERTKAILVVHIYGLPVDMDPILDLSKRYNLKVIEDAAEMHGQTCRGKPCGSFGDISTFSFYSNKHITTGEGGMLVTNNSELAEKCRSLRNLCFQPEKRFVHEELGWNFRMTNLQAAVGIAQLERLDFVVERKRHIGKLYTECLQDVPGIELPMASTDYADNIYWVYGLVLSEALPLNAEKVIASLSRNGIGSRPFFWPMHEQPVFNKMGLFYGESYPVAERLAMRGFYLPSGTPIGDEQIEEVCQKVKQILG